MIYRLDKNNKSTVVLSLLMMSMEILFSIFITIAIIYVLIFSLGFMMAVLTILLIIWLFMTAQRFILKKLVKS